MFEFKQPTIKDVIEALDALNDVKQPAGDNEGEAINSPSVYEQLPPEHQQIVDNAESVTCRYLRKPGDYGSEPNQRSITELNKHGYAARLNFDQYDQASLVGSVVVRDLVLDVSDPKVPDGSDD